MAGRCCARNGDLAATVAWPDGRRPARILGPRLYAVERDLRAVLFLHPLARHAVDWRVAGALRALCAQVCQRTAGVAGEPTATTRGAARGARPASLDLQA